MKTLVSTLALGATLMAANASACPEYLNNSMRKLASKEVINFCEAYAGKPMLIVNTASNCGYTPQFDGLEKLHKDYESKGLVVIGFSSDTSPRRK
jgi:Glutathione peroxidase